MKNMNRQNRTGIFLLACLLMLNRFVRPSYAAPAWPADAGIMAEAGIAMDENSGAVLFGQNIHVAYPPASITKLLTALVVAENAALDENVTFSHDAVYNVESGSGNSLGLEEGDVLTVRDCLHALLLRSSNQAANALAEHVAGSRGAFVENDDEQYVTAYDMALIARAAFANETVLSVDSDASWKLPATIKNPDGLTISMEHKVLAARNNPASQYYLEGALAGKTGYTSIAGNTLVTYAVRNGRGVISVVLKGTQPQYYLDGKTLIEFGFASFQDIRIAEQENFLAETDGIDRDGDHYKPSELYLEEEACVTVPNGASFADVTRTVTSELGYAHPKTAVARLDYTYNNRKVGSAYVCARNLHFSTEPLSVSILDTEGAEDVVLADGRTTGGADVPEAESGNGWAVVLGAVLLLAALSGAVFWIWYRRQKALAEAARRGARRLQRIRELGYTEEDFEKMVRERMKTGGRNGRR